MRRGVWLSAEGVLTINEGAKGDDVLVIEVPEEAVLPYEFIEDGKPYREFLVPASLLNRYPIMQFWECDECEKLLIQRDKPSRWYRERGRSVLGEPMTMTLCDDCEQKRGELLKAFLPD